MYNELKLFTLEELTKINQVKLLWKIKNEHLPYNIQNIFLKRNELDRPQRSIFKISQARTNYKERFISVTGAKFWNQIPSQVKSIEFLPLFMKRYKEWLKSSN